MTRKDYELIAAAFKAARADVTEKEPESSHKDMLDGISLAVEHVADALKRQNELFYRNRFLTACGVQS